MELLLNFLLFVTTIPICYFVSGSQAATNGTDHLALLSFKDLITDDPSGVLKSWGNSSAVSYCQWRGVTCGAQGQRRDRVTALELPRLNLSGTISPKIANLTFLTRLDLSKNQLHGTVPYELSLLLNLNHLGLSFNTLDGNILPSLSRCSSLRNISLGFNNLQGKKFAC
jgi:Leucine-rich repeat (LRR) protein